MKKYCTELSSEAWCILYHKHNKRTFLVPVEQKTKLVKEVNGKPDPFPGIQSAVSDILACQFISKCVFQK